MLQTNTSYSLRYVIQHWRQLICIHLYKIIIFIVHLSVYYAKYTLLDGCLTTHVVKLAMANHCLQYWRGSLWTLYTHTSKYQIISVQRIRSAGNPTALPLASLRVVDSVGGRQVATTQIPVLNLLQHDREVAPSGELWVLVLPGFWKQVRSPLHYPPPHNLCINYFE